MVRETFPGDTSRIWVYVGWVHPACSAGILPGHQQPTFSFLSSFLCFFPCWAHEFIHINVSSPSVCSKHQGERPPLITQEPRQREGGKAREGQTRHPAPSPPAPAPATVPYQIVSQSLVGRASRVTHLDKVPAAVSSSRGPKLE